ncbi:DUF559 domain-containing protein [Microbacterium rhizomatis]|uniref:DUF559 domain-containing protein n=1 Tax=Microbacterium rhizomatis TaxID=1631477 RepID=A0A5J5JA36_9MICO|nr:DUF559 domain-containing protein [Microbacterium rhizomatis]
MEELVEWVAAKGGVVHSHAVKAEGFTVHAIRTAVHRGALYRIRRSWLARPGCDPLLRRAAELGGRTTCLTEAQLIGLWTPDHTTPHFAVPPTASRLDADGARLHWSRGPSPLAATGMRDPLVNVLHHVAHCAPPADALAVWESAIRKKHVAPDVLARVEWRGDVARRIAREASDLSDSGIETRFLVLMRGIDVIVRQQVWIDGHPVDALVGAHLAVQLDGFAHHQAGDRRRDLRADARLRLRGYTVLRFDYHQVLFQPDYVVEIMSAALAQGLHR